MSTVVEPQSHPLPGTEAEHGPKNVTGRLGIRPVNRFRALFGSPWQRRLSRAALLVPAVRRREKEFDKLSDAEIKQYAARLRGRARGGKSLDKLLPEAFGLVCVAAKRTLGLRPFDVQLAAGVVMHSSVWPNWPPAKARRSPPRCRPFSTPWPAKAFTSPPSTITWPTATPSGSAPSTEPSA